MDIQNQEASGLEVLPRVAREAIRASLQGRDPERLVTTIHGALAVSAPVFVTLRLHGELRGCVGAMEPYCDDLVGETADRAVAAAFSDTRFDPLTLGELDECTIEVTVLAEPEPTDSLEELDPRRFGIEVEDTVGRRGVLLPNIDGVDTVEQQLSIACRKAGIAPGARYSVRRFEVLKVPDPDRS